jgi:ferredoxin--NADP+ reductase
MYAAERLLEQAPHCVVDLFERLPCPWGLVRRGVAPDHPEKKLVIDRNFEVSLRDPRVSLFAGVHVGVDVTAAELASWYDAVIYATGGTDDRLLGIPGEELPGCYAALAFIGWCNGDPVAAQSEFDLACERAVIVGNGNVALDVARLLTVHAAALEGTDISMRALNALRSSRVREVVVLGRRGPAEAAFHNPELEELEYVDGVTVGIEGADLWDESVSSLQRADLFRKIRTLRRLQARPALPGNKTIIFHFHCAPLAFEGTSRVEAVQLSQSRLATKLVIRAIGYRSSQILGLPYDSVGAVIPNRSGRVFEGAHAVPGVYVAGWAKRGCRGVIGSNKRCARETVAALLDDQCAGRLPRGTADVDTVHATLAARGLNVITKSGWRAIDHAEREAGRLHARPRIKIESTQQMWALAREG